MNVLGGFQSRVRALDGERGAISVLVAILLPVLLVASAMAMDVLAVSTAEREHQRAADAGALAAAAAVPLVNLSAIPLAGGAWAPGDAGGARGCTVATTMAADGPSTRANGSGPTGCTVTWEPDDPALLTTLLGSANSIVGAASVLNRLGFSTGSLLDSLVPAVTAPRARTVVTASVAPPMRGLVPAQVADAVITTEATARRRLKNAVLLPVLTAEGRCPSGTLLGGLINWLLGTLSTLLGNAADIGELASRLDGCRADVNPLLDQSAQALFPRLEATGSRLDQLGLPGTAITQSLLVDLRDIAQPTGAGAPTQREVLQAAAARDEHVLVVLVGVTSSTAVPMLDVFPVLAADLLSRNLSDLAMSDLFGLATTSTQARGLFRASLVR